MTWIDYVILHRPGYGFKVKGDWEGEVMGHPDPDNPTRQKDHWLYKPGELYKVDDNGWLVKLEHWM